MSVRGRINAALELLKPFRAGTFPAILKVKEELRLALEELDREETETDLWHERFRKLRDEKQGV